MKHSIVKSIPLRSVLGLAVGALFLWLALERLDWLAFRASLGSIRLAPLFLALCFLTGDFFLRIVRWWWMLRIFAPRLCLGTCAGPFLASFAINNVMPFRAGDLFRSIGFREQLQSPVSRILGTIFVERLLDLSVLLGFLFVGLWGLPAGRLPGSFVSTAIGLALICLVIVIGVLIAPKWVMIAVMRLENWPGISERVFLRRPLIWVKQFIETLMGLSSPVLMLRLFAVSIVAWLLEGAVFASVSRSFSVHVVPFGPWFSLATGTLATVLPGTPGYVGTFDYFAAMGLVAYGAKMETAVAFSLLVHVVLWLPITVAGSLYLVAPQGRVLWGRVRTAQIGK